MNVFKKGNKPYVYYTKCEECGSIISFMKSELSWSHRLNCPVCKNSIYTDICLHEGDPYLGDDEVKKEVEEFLNNEKNQGLPIGRPTYVPNKKEEVTIKVDPDNISEIVNTIKDSSEFESVLEKILREVKVEPIPTYIRDGKPYEPSRTNDWSNPYGVTIRNLNT